MRGLELAHGVPVLTGKRKPPFKGQARIALGHNGATIMGVSEMQPMSREDGLSLLAQALRTVVKLRGHGRPMDVLHRWRGVPVHQTGETQNGVGKERDGLFVYNVAPMSVYDLQAFAWRLFVIGQFDAGAVEDELRRLG